MPTHGPQHDDFRADSGVHHGGARFDEGFRNARVPDTHGKLFDQFSESPGVDRYGERWDHFPWREMPAKHGQMFDSDFGQPVAHDGGEHGTWHDVFRGGAVRYIAGGKDYEGVVTNVGSESATVLSREGEEHEIGLGQVLAYCEAAALQGNPHVEEYLTRAEPSPFDFEIEGEVLDAQAQNLPIPGPQGERPSGSSRKAMGGGRSASSTDLPPVVEQVTGKSVTDRLVDVCKKHGTCAACGMDAKLVKIPGTAKHKHAGKSLCKGCAGLAGLLTQPGTFKEVDSSEGAVVKQDLEGGASDLWCPKCKHVCRDAEGGRCPTCGSNVTAKPEGEGDAEKAWMRPLDVLKTEEAA